MPEKGGRWKKTFRHAIFPRVFFAEKTLHFGLPKLEKPGMTRAAVGHTVEGALSARWENIPVFDKMPRVFLLKTTAGAGAGKHAVL